MYKRRTLMSKTQKTAPEKPPAWQADPRPLWGMNAGAFILGSAALLVLSRFRILISLPFAVAAIAAMAGVFAAEIGLWYSRGVRRVRIEGGCVVLEGRPDRAARRIEHSEIRRVRMTRRLGGGRILIELKLADSPAWIRFLLRLLHGRIVLRGELFTPADFRSMFEELSRLASRRIPLG
jgi:hypothetical protein